MDAKHQVGLHNDGVHICWLRNYLQVDDSSKERLYELQWPLASLLPQTACGVSSSTLNGL
ncbi:hypothetical protein N7454_007581 [Penicillium verhagenii]|nr:hypothetical protein N7454_007581 [Penicillium verhagenii]